MFVSVETQNSINDIKTLEDIFDFSDLDENHVLFSNKNKKIFGLFKIETPKNIWIDEFVSFRSKAYSFKCNDIDENKKKIKVISKSQTKHIILEDKYNCLFGGKHQKECDNYIIRSVNHDMYLQKIRKSTLSVFDDKQ